MFRLSLTVTAAYLLIPIINPLYAQRFEKMNLPPVYEEIITCSLVDINQDFYPDISMSFSYASPVFFMSQEEGIFEESTVALEEEEAIRELNWVDYNNDGLMDLFALNAEGYGLIYDNPQTPYSSQYPYLFPQKFHSGNANQWLDVNQDGWLDLYIEPCKDRAGFFYEYTPYEGFQSIEIPMEFALEKDCHYVYSWADWDQNGTEDLFVTSAKKGAHFFRNEGNKSWRSVNYRSSNNEQKVSISHHWVDYDNDGDQDLFVLNKAYAPQIFANNGYGKFYEAKTSIPFSSSKFRDAIWVDIDNDGDQDVLIKSASCGRSQLVCYLNEQRGVFSQSPLELCSLESQEIKDYLFTDYDLDGRQDLFVLTSEESTEPVQLYRNNFSEKNWLLLKCQGNTATAPLTNSQGIGTKVYVKTTKEGKSQWQMRVLKPQKSSRFQGDMLIHFGLGEAEKAEAMRIEWPSGRIEYFAGVEANHLYVFKEAEGVEKVK